MVLTATISSFVSSTPPPNSWEIATNVWMPKMNLGTCCGSDPTVGLLPWLKAGGIGIDTAYSYTGSQIAIASVLASPAASKWSRADLFITTKICQTECTGVPLDVCAKKLLQQDLNRLNTTYVDLVPPAPIDMRGPVAVTHASAAAAVAAEEGGIRGERGPASTLGRELLYNLAQLRELSAAHHLSALQRRDALAADLGAKRSELAAINHDAAKGLSARGQRTAALLSALDEIQDGARSFRAGVARARPGAAARAQIELCDRLHSVRKRFAPEWERQQMWRLVCATAVPAPSAESSAALPAGLAEPLLRACAQEWSLESESVALSNLQKSSRSGKSSRRSPDATRALAASLRPWHALLCSSFAPGASGFLDPLEEAELTDLSSIFDALVESCILPRLRRVAAKEWRVKDASSNAPMVHAMHSLLPLLADAQIEAFALDSLLPKLAREVEAWDPLRDTTHLHAWLLPWHSFFVAAAGDGDENENVNGNASEKGKKKGESVGAAAAAASFPPLATLRDTIFP
jgi:hypothetical protein